MGSIAASTVSGFGGAGPKRKIIATPKEVAVPLYF